MLRLVVALCLLGVAVCGPSVSRSRSEIEKFRNFLESTRTGHGVLVKKSLLSPETSAWENSGRYQGDILLYDEQLQSMVEQYAQGRNAYIAPGTRWPNRTVVFEIDSTFTQSQRRYILYAIRILQERTCIRFRTRTADDVDYVLVTGEDSGCYAGVGYRESRGVHSMNLAPSSPGSGCFNIITIVHEWLHIIGFFHMQSTYNRDDYVVINWDNIIEGVEGNFEKLDSDIVSNLGLPYEYDSCMHYSAFAFSSNGLPTITATQVHIGIMGQRSYVTNYDFQRVNRHYGCEAWNETQTYKLFTTEEAAGGLAAFLIELKEEPEQ